MAIEYYRRRWIESRGDEFSSWGPAMYYFEVDGDGWPIRQMEVYDSGPALRYGPGHDEDEFGLLGQALLDQPRDWQPWVISEAEFERAWQDKR